MTDRGRILLKEIRNGLQTSKCRNDILKWLTLTRAVINPKFLQSDPKRLEALGFDYSDIEAVTKDDLQANLKRIYEVLISLFSVEWLRILTTESFSDHVKPLFAEGPSIDVFLALFKAVAEPKRKDFSFHKCVMLLDEFLTRNRLFRLLQDESSRIQDSTAPQFLDVQGELMVSCLSSLPDKLANTLQLENSEKFLPQNYIPMLALSIFDACHGAHDLLSQGQSVSLVMVSSLLGKICLTGRADLLLDSLLPHLCVKVRSDFIWCRICERVFTKVPARSLEAVVTPLLKKITWYGLVEKFLGDSVVHDSVIKTLMCTKLLLHRFCSKPKLLLQNIIGYLASFHTRRHLLMEVCLRLLRVWGDSSSLKHTSSEQHLYISQAVLMCIGNLNETERLSNKDKLLQMLMPGVEAHLASSDPATRMVGMTVAKTLTDTVDPSGPKLEFELDMGSKLVTELLSYKDVLPQDPGLSPAEETILANNVDANVDDAVKGINSAKLQDAKEAHSDLDSDDDLEPYDMSNDIKVLKAKPPKYVRDCMEGLISSSEDPDKTEMCLQHAESLIKKHPFGLDEIASEFTKILLHLQDTHNFKSYLINRFKALVALAVECPEQVAEYLTKEFYERNYSLRQRMDILEVLARAAVELSQPEESKSVISQHTSPAVLSSEPGSWREIVQKRIESNTRRFARGRSKPEPKPKLNRFSPVAGQFFYPLMTKVDKSEPCLDLLGKDSCVLFQLLYTLAVVLYSSLNIPTAGHMGRTLLEFTWPIRHHPDVSVRQAVLVATSSIFMVVPAHQLIMDMHQDVMETKSWLEDVIEQDPDTESQKLSAQTLLLLENQIKKELESDKT